MYPAQTARKRGKGKQHPISLKGQVPKWILLPEGLRQKGQKGRLKGQTLKIVPVPEGPTPEGKHRGA